jgi:hypothetical protein
MTRKTLRQEVFREDYQSSSSPAGGIIEADWSEFLPFRSFSA